MGAKYKVQRNYIYGWDDGFFSDDNGEIPTLFNSKKEAEAAAKQQKWDAITGGITGAANMFAGFGQG